MSGQLAGAIRFPARPASRGAVRARTWWGRSWVRAIEEAAYDEADLRRARTLARSGRVGAISVSVQGFVAAVEDADGMWAVSGRLTPLPEPDVAAFCEAVAAEAGRVGALLSGDLPHGLVEHAEEAGVELLPYASDVATTCSCDFWADPCPHALAVAYQLGWLMDDDPFVLLHLRGLPRGDLLERLERHDAPQDPDAPEDPEDPDVATALDAAARAARIVELAEAGQPVDHLL